MNDHRDGNKGGGERRSAGRGRERERSGSGYVGGVEARRRTLDGNGDGNGVGSKDSSGDRNGNEDKGNGNEDKIGEGGREAKKRKKPQNGCMRHAGSGRDLGGMRKKCRNKRLVQ